MPDPPRVTRFANFLFTVGGTYSCLFSSKLQADPVGASPMVSGTFLEPVIIGGGEAAAAGSGRVIPAARVTAQIAEAD